MYGREDGADADGFYDSRYPDYVLGIIIFALTVVAYTTYGGFWAVTWTDVLQGLVIVAGALLLMVLALLQGRRPDRSLAQAASSRPAAC